jgi:hypothetical protein
VFHIEDGQKGLDRLIEFSGYLAVGAPELRIVKGKAYKEAVYRLASYIKNNKPDIDVHLLGCTEKSVLNKCWFCTSADSTSWEEVNRYGALMRREARYIREEMIEAAIPSVKKMLYYISNPSKKEWGITASIISPRFYIKSCMSDALAEKIKYCCIMIWRSIT